MGWKHEYIILAQSFASQLSYAEIASKGPKQSPSEAAAPPPPELENTEAASTSSLVDVDTPSVHTVPSDFDAEQPPGAAAATEAERLMRDMDAQKARDRGKRSGKNGKGKKTHGGGSGGGGGGSGGGRADADDGSAAERWLARTLGALDERHPRAAQAVMAGNLVAVVGLGALLGTRAWNLYARGELNWRVAAIGAGVLGALGLAEGAVANYYYKTRSKKE
ncbi:hypothetical protein SPI_01673 [Niveomyces insectorum RCEF 264]|uniref:Uncharacterized protein n=1 Tax=Niveomyces insectorum RCEF 264 TaxID=1081102 RepID=A0A167Z4Z4_9HYPO|nr:hypothetical protein SPI_01673 [Niveomyces insectorum RCEF 264]